MLRALTIAILVAVCVETARFVQDRIKALKRGDRVLTNATLRGLLIGAGVVGLVLRMVAWDPGHEGVVAWIGGGMLVISIAGLIWLQFLKERAARSDRDSFYFNPYWRYGLLLMCIAALVIQGLAKPEGAASTLNVAVFWLALITLVVQTTGRCILRRRHQSSSAQAGPNY